MINDIRALLLDMDGVLVDSYHAWYQLMNNVARSLGYPAIDADRFRAAWGQSVEDDVDWFYPEHDVSAIQARYDRQFAQHLDQVRIDPHARDLLARAKALGLATAVVTNTPRTMARSILAHAGLRPDTLVCGTDVPAAKPAPDMLVEACLRLSVPSTCALMVGDSRFDREAAAAASVRFVGLRMTAAHTISNLAELLDLVSPGH